MPKAVNFELFNNFKIHCYFSFRVAKKSRKKLTKAFSFSRTPHRVVQRAVSNAMTPSPISMRALANAKSNYSMQHGESTTWDDSANDSDNIFGSGKKL